MITEIRNNDMSAISAAPVAVVDFNATWCGPCRMLGPVLEEISRDMAGRVSFFGVDVDENSALAAQFGVMSVPMVVLLKNGVKQDVKIGFAPKADYVRWIESHL